MAPAKPSKVVQKRLRQVTIELVMHHRYSPVALGELLAIGPMNHGKVGVLRYCSPQCLKNIHLPWRVVNVVIAPNDMANGHVHVVNHNTEVIGRRPIGSGNNQVVELGIGNANSALDPVVPAHHAMVGVTKTNNKGLLGLG